MIIDRNFLNNWKVRLLIGEIGELEAIKALLGLWAYCESCRAWELQLTAAKLAGICCYTGPKEDLWNAMLECGFLHPCDDEGWFIVHGWAEYNATLIRSWGAKRGGWNPRGKIPHMTPHAGKRLGKNQAESTRIASTPPESTTSNDQSQDDLKTVLRSSQDHPKTSLRPSKDCIDKSRVDKSRNITPLIPLTGGDASASDSCSDSDSSLDVPSSPSQPDLLVSETKNPKDGEKSKRAARRVVDELPLPGEGHPLESCREALAEWLEYKTLRRQRYKAKGWQMLLRDLSQYPASVVAEAIKVSIINHWQGLFPSRILEDQQKSMDRRVGVGSRGINRREEEAPPVGAAVTDHVSEEPSDWRAAADALYDFDWRSLWSEWVYVPASNQLEIRQYLARSKTKSVPAAAGVDGKEVAA